MDRDNAFQDTTRPTWKVIQAHWTNLMKVRLVGAARVKNCDFLSKNPKQQVTTSGHFTFFSSECTCIRLWACNLDHTLTIWLVWG